MPFFLFFSTIIRHYEKNKQCSRKKGSVTLNYENGNIKKGFNTKAKINNLIKTNQTLFFFLGIERLELSRFNEPTDFQ